MYAIRSYYEHRLGLVLGADDVDHLVQVEKGHQQTIQQVQPALHLLQPVLQPAAHGFAAEGQPFGEQLGQALNLGPVVHPQYVEVDPITLLQIRAGEQVLHQLLRVHPVGARHYDDAGSYNFV